MAGMLYLFQRANNVTIAYGWRVVLETLCTHKAITSAKYTVDGTTDSVTQVVIDSIIQSICPSQCSGHGTCVNSNCECDPGKVMLF